MRKYYWYFTAFLRKHGTIMLVSVIFAVCFFSLVLPRIITAIEQKNRQYVGLIGEYTLDTLPPRILDQISLGLTQKQANGTVIPSIAQRWVTEDDGRTYRFVIRDNLVWQDGKSVTPNDIVYNFKDLETIRTPTDIIFKLPDAYVPFPSVVSQPILRFEQVRHLFFMTRPMPIGIGAYRVVDYSLANNRLKELILDSPKERIVYRFYLTEDQAVTAFKQGQVDVLPDMSSSHDLDGWPNVNITRTIRPDRYLAVFFNNSSSLFPKHIRQGLSYALTKPNEEYRALGPINPTSWVYLESSKRYDYDIPRGIERMLDEPPSTALNIELTTTSNFLEEAETIKQEWESFGKKVVASCKQKNSYSTEECEKFQITVTLRVSNFPDISNFQALLIGQETPSDPDQYHLWHSEQNTNFTRYSNTRIDALLERGRTTGGSNERRTIYQEFQQFFLEDAPAVFLRHLDSIRIERI
jgi:peptide/nickel transport system substrate-binding protein